MWCTEKEKQKQSRRRETTEMNDGHLSTHWPKSKERSFKGSYTDLDDLNHTVILAIRITLSSLIKKLRCWLPI